MQMIAGAIVILAAAVFAGAWVLAEALGDPAPVPKGLIQLLALGAAVIGFGILFSGMSDTGAKRKGRDEDKG